MAPAEPITSLALSTAIERCLIAKRAENRSPRTVTAYGYALGLVVSVRVPTRPGTRRATVSRLPRAGTR